MIDELDVHKRRQVESWLERPLEDHELVPVSGLAELTLAQRAVVDILARRHRLACMMYLRAVVHDLLINDAFAFIDEIRGPYL